MNPTCKQCGKREVEDARACYATPVCFACLPEPRPLNTAWSLPAEWLAEMAEVLEHVRHEDSAPLRLTPKLLLELVGALREEKDHWQKRAESAEFSLGVSQDECALLRQNEPLPRCNQCGAHREPWQDRDETRCPKHAVPEPYSSCDGTLEKPNA